MANFTKEDVLNREEIIMSKDIDPKYFVSEGIYDRDQFWEGGTCYVPVRYKAKPYKLRVRVKSNNI